MSEETKETPQENPLNDQLKQAQINKLEAEAKKIKAEAEILSNQQKKQKIDIQKTQILLEKEEISLKQNKINLKKDKIILELKQLDLESELESIEIRNSRDDKNYLYRFNDKVSSESVKRCMQTLTEWSRLDPECAIEIIFSSPGGSIIDGFELFDFLNN